MAGERISALAFHLAGIAARQYGSAIHVAVRNPDVDLALLIDRANQDAMAELRPENLRAIMGHCDEMAMESVHSAMTLCNEAVQYALCQRTVHDKRLAARTRSRLIMCMAHAYISKWSDDRGVGVGDAF